MVGLVPQEEHLSFKFAIMEYVLLGRTPYLGQLTMPRQDDRQVALEALEATGLIALRDRSVLSLSGGERQLATVARALAQQPRILLLDEPTSHLDLANKRRVLQVLRTMANSGVTVVFSTHDPGADSDIAGFVVKMKGGRSDD